MSMPDLWSPAAMVPRERTATRHVAIVSRERIPPSEMEAAIAAAWADGYRAASIVVATTVTYSAEPPPPMMDDIFRHVARKHGITVRELKSVRRDPLIVRARWEAMWRCKKETSHSLPQIGRALGGRDHTTVLYGIRRHEALMAKEAHG